MTKPVFRSCLTRARSDLLDRLVDRLLDRDEAARERWLSRLDQT